MRRVGPDGANAADAAGSGDDRQLEHVFPLAGAEEAKRMVAQFRATHDVWAGDPAFAELLERLRRGSPEFARWWGAHEVRGTASGRKVLHHPKRGTLHYEYTSYQSNDDPALKLVICTPVAPDQ